MTVKGMQWKIASLLPDHKSTRILGVEDLGTAKGFSSTKGSKLKDIKAVTLQLFTSVRLICQIKNLYRSLILKISRFKA